MDVENNKIRLASLEYFLADRCNLRCEHCAASSPWLRDANMPTVEDFRGDVARLAGVLSADQIKFVGGEPLLHPAVCDFLRAARESGVFTRVRVTTNGVLLARMPEEFWDLADVVEISRYPGIEQPDAEAFARLAAIAAEHGTTLEQNRIDQFMIAVCEQPIDDARRVERIFRSCGEANGWSCHLLYRGRLYRCSRVHTLDRYLGERGVAHAHFTEEDGLPLDGPDRFEAIRAYLTSTTPLQACRHCLGTSGRWVDNRQLSVDELRRRRAEPARPFDAAALVGPEEAHLRNLISTWATAGGGIRRS